MIKKYAELDPETKKNPAIWLAEELSSLDGSTDFIYAVKEVLGKEGRELVWFVGMVNNYHNHPDMLIGSLIKTRVHFRKIAMTALHEQNYDSYFKWISNWSSLLAICRHIDPNWRAEEKDEL